MIYKVLAQLTNASFTSTYIRFADVRLQSIPVHMYIGFYKNNLYTLGAGRL